MKSKTSSVRPSGTGRTRGSGIEKKTKKPGPGRAQGFCLEGGVGVGRGSRRGGRHGWFRTLTSYDNHAGAHGSCVGLLKVRRLRSASAPTRLPPLSFIKCQFTMRYMRTRGRCRKSMLMRGRNFKESIQENRGVALKSLLEIPKREEGERDKKSWTDEDGFDGSKKTLRRNGHRGATMTTTVPKLDLAGVARADGEVEDPPVPAKGHGEGQGRGGAEAERSGFLQSREERGRRGTCSSDADEGDGREAPGGAPRADDGRLTHRTCAFAARIIHNPQITEHVSHNINTLITSWSSCAAAGSASGCCSPRSSPSRGLPCPAP